MFRLFRKRPEPARAEGTALAGALDKAGNGKVWLVKILDHSGVIKRYVVTTKLASVFGDGWTEIAKNTFMRKTKRGTEILHITPKGEVLKWFFAENGDHFHDQVAWLDRAEVVQ